MKETFKEGLRRTRRITVDEARAITFLGKDMRTYATPEMVRDVEVTCRDLIAEMAEKGEDSVGMRVEIEHLAPTLMGMWADISIVLTRIDGRRIDFAFEVTDAFEPVGRGTHRRFVIEVAKTAERIAANAARVAAEA